MFGKAVHYCRLYILPLAHVAFKKVMLKLKEELQIVSQLNLQ